MTRFKCYYFLLTLLRLLVFDLLALEGIGYPILKERELWY